MGREKKDFFELWDLAMNGQGMGNFESLRKEIRKFGFGIDIVIEPFKLPLLSIHSIEGKTEGDHFCVDAEECIGCHLVDFCENVKKPGSECKQKTRKAFIDKIKRFFK